MGLMGFKPPIYDDARCLCNRQNKDAVLKLVRHDCAHIMAKLCWSCIPEPVTIGPAIENGFYYDFIVNSPLRLMIWPQLRLAAILSGDEPIELGLEQGRCNCVLPRKKRTVQN